MLGQPAFGLLWSLYFCQRILGKWLRSLSLTAQSRLLNERSGVAVLDVHRYQTKVAKSSPATIDYHDAYVDNVGAVGRTDEVVTASLEDAKEVFEGRGPNPQGKGIAMGLPSLWGGKHSFN